MHSAIGEVKQQKETHYDPVRQKNGDDTGVPVIREAFVAPTREEAIGVAERHLWDKYQRYIDWGQDEAMEDRQELHRPFEELAEDRLLATPETVCRELERYERELNAKLVLFRYHWLGLSCERARGTIELTGDEVILNV